MLALSFRTRMYLLCYFNFSECNKIIHTFKLITDFFSHGSSYGEKGYIRIAKGKNMCRIADEAVYPATSSTAAASKTPKFASGCSPAYMKKPYLFVSILFVANILNIMY